MAREPHVKFYQLHAPDVSSWRATCLGAPQGAPSMPAAPACCA